MQLKCCVEGYIHVNNICMFDLNYNTLLDCFGFFCRSDADPASLAKYVVALVKKDKVDKDLKEVCIDQLEVFLQTSKL